MTRAKARVSRLTVAAVGAALVSTACFSSEPGPRSGPTADVEVSANDGLRFEPANVTIRVGQTVLWRNTGTLVHTVTFDASRALDPDNVRLPPGVQPFHSQLGSGQEFTYTFTTPGQYEYLCEPHELAGMLGSVTVTP